LPEKSGRPRAKVDSRRGHMSGKRAIVTFSMTAPTAKICSPTASIQKLVRLKHSKPALCAMGWLRLVGSLK